MNETIGASDKDLEFARRIGAKIDDYNHGRHSSSLDWRPNAVRNVDASIAYLREIGGAHATEIDCDNVRLFACMEVDAIVKAYNRIVIDQRISPQDDQVIGFLGRCLKSKVKLKWEECEIGEFLPMPMLKRYDASRFNRCAILDDSLDVPIKSEEIRTRTFELCSFRTALGTELEMWKRVE